MDFRNALVAGVAEAADGGDDVEAELMVRQREVRRGLGAVRLVETRAVGVGAACLPPNCKLRGRVGTVKVALVF